ncbi:MAG: RNA 2',3'-cyclic phosphodiesterase [Nanoarchaeota archaeon]
MPDKKMHRVFIAIDFPSEVIEEVARIQEILRKLNFTGKVSELENLHLTFKFLGEVDLEKLEEVKNKLKNIKFDSFDARLENIGTFSFRGNPRIVWIKVKGKGIFELQKKIDEMMGELGFKLEERFMGHMTIARIKYVKDKEKFKKYVGEIGLKDIRFKIKNFNLKESELKMMGPIYTDLEIYELD